MIAFLDLVKYSDRGTADILANICLSPTSAPVLQCCRHWTMSFDLSSLLLENRFPYQSCTSRSGFDQSIDGEDALSLPL